MAYCRTQKALQGTDERDELEVESENVHPRKAAEKNDKDICVMYVVALCTCLLSKDRKKRKTNNGMPNCIDYDIATAPEWQT